MKINFWVLGLSMSMLPSLVIADWADWWRTPEQRALKLFESGEHEALIEQSPDDNWAGLGQFQGENFTEAAANFAKSREALQADGLNNEATTALYNQGVSDVLSGQYEQAIEHFDNVLSENPGFTDAQHNRDIAEQLLELQQNPEQSQDQNGEQGEQGEEGEQGEQGEQGEDGEQGEQGEQGSSESDQSSGQSDGESSESESDEASNSDSDSEDSDTESAAQEQQDQEEQEAREALAAEAMKEAQENGEGAEQTVEQLVESEEPLSESEQATEQILRRIPDDPRGLLRRKLEQSHRNEFPEVRDAIEPW